MGLVIEFPHSRRQTTSGSGGSEPQPVWGVGQVLAQSAEAAHQNGRIADAMWLIDTAYRVLDTAARPDNRLMALAMAGACSPAMESDSWGA